MAIEWKVGDYVKTPWEEVQGEIEELGDGSAVVRAAPLVRYRIPLGLLSREGHAPEFSFIDRIKNHPFASLGMKEGLYATYIEGADCIALVDQGGFIPTREEVQEIADKFFAFLDHYGEEKRRQHNTECWLAAGSPVPDPLPPPRVLKGGPNPKAGYVYLIRAFTDHYKIGKSRNPKARMSTFGIQLPVKSEVIHLIKCEDMSAAEKALHLRYANQRAEGEWFKLEDADVEWIKTLTEWQ